MAYAPVVAFCYNRPDKIKKILTTLAECAEARDTDLIVFSDGPRGLEDEEKVLKVRQELKKITGFKSITIEERKTNYGLAINLVDGIDRVLKQYTRAIICEDDILASPYFLKFMNKALDVYEPIKKIFTVAATLPFETTTDYNRVIFGEVASCWGWAIWRDRWPLYERNVGKAYEELRDMDLRKRFNMGNRLNMGAAIDGNYHQTINTWAVFLNYAPIKHNLLNVYPPKTIVTNIGQDGSGTHGVVDSVITAVNIDVDALEFPTQNITEDLMPVLIPALDKFNKKAEIEQYNQTVYLPKEPPKKKKVSKLKRIIRILKGKE